MIGVRHADKDPVLGIAKFQALVYDILPFGGRCQKAMTGVRHADKGGAQHSRYFRGSRERFVP